MRRRSAIGRRRPIGGAPEVVPVVTLVCSWVWLIGNAEFGVHENRTPAPKHVLRNPPDRHSPNGRTHRAPCAKLISANEVSHLLVLVLWPCLPFPAVSRSFCSPL